MASSSISAGKTCSAGFCGAGVGGKMGLFATAGARGFKGEEGDGAIAIFMACAIWGSTPPTTAVISGFGFIDLISSNC